MYIKILLNYILGYVNIIVEGFFTERFINICMSKDILLFNIKRDKSTIIYANVGIHDFKNAVQIAKQTKCKIKIKRKSGLPFIFNRYRKRKIFVGALAVIICTVIYLSNFIWNIEIEGADNIDSYELMQTVNNEGLTVGKLKNKVDLKSIINKIRLDREDIAWIGIDLKGTNAIVKVVPADSKPEIIKEDEYCNIISNKEACIIKVNAQNGTPLVKEGDIVKLGTPLIAGWMEGKYTGRQYVHSQGEVQAKVWYTATEKISLKETKKVETGNVENKYSVKINNFQINLHKSIPKFQKYDTIEENKKLKLFSNFYLPLELITYTYKEYEEVVVIHSVEEAKQIGLEKSKETLKTELEGKEILDTQVKVKQEADYIEVEVTYEVEENIGVKEKIVF